MSLQEAGNISFFQSGKIPNTWELDQERYRLERMMNSNGDPIIVRGLAYHRENFDQNGLLLNRDQGRWRSDAV